MSRQLGRYEIIEEVGRGTTGIVYRARDPVIDRFLAIKAINLQDLSDAERARSKARFYQEAMAVGRFNHPSLVTIYDLGENGDVAYIAMELLEGRVLQDILDRNRRLAVDEALNIAVQVASGLCYAHQHGVVHRDIKPANIMVLNDNRVKIFDFGIAKVEASLLRTRAGVILGSLLYMSPEQVSKQAIDGRSDIFSLGILLYQMLTGIFPFSGDTDDAVMHDIANFVPQSPSALNPEVPDMLDRIVAKCLEKKPGARYQDADELEDDLRSCRGMLLHARSGHEYHRHFFKSNVVTYVMKLGKWKSIGIIVLIAAVSVGLFEWIEHLF